MCDAFNVRNLSSSLPLPLPRMM